MSTAVNSLIHDREREEEPCTTTGNVYPHSCTASQTEYRLIYPRHCTTAPWNKDTRGDVMKRSEEEHACYFEMRMSTTAHVLTGLTTTVGKVSPKSTWMSYSFTWDIFGGWMNWLTVQKIDLRCDCECEWWTRIGSSTPVTLLMDKNGDEHPLSKLQGLSAICPLSGVLFSTTNKGNTTKLLVEK